MSWGRRDWIVNKMTRAPKTDPHVKAEPVTGRYGILVLWGENTAQVEALCP